MTAKRLPNGFYFQTPKLSKKLSHGARVAITVGSLASRLTREERTRTIHPDGRAENVAEHSFMLAKVSLSLYRALKVDLPQGMDEGKIAIAAINHDDPEAYVLDTATDRITEEQLLEKSLREAEGVEQLLQEFDAIDHIYAASVARYEKQTDVNDRFVRMVDKLMTLLIHIPNDAAALRDNYTVEEIRKNTIEHSERFRKEYPEFSVISDLREELVDFLIETYL